MIVKQQQEALTPLPDRLVSRAVTVLRNHSKWSVNEAIAEVVRNDKLLALFYGTFSDHEKAALVRRVKASRGR